MPVIFSPERRAATSREARQKSLQDLAGACQAAWQTGSSFQATFAVNEEAMALATLASELGLVALPQAGRRVVVSNPA